MTTPDGGTRRGGIPLTPEGQQLAQRGPVALDDRKIGDALRQAADGSVRLPGQRGGWVSSVRVTRGRWI